MLDDSVSEEDGSFEELTEGTPYLQPEVDLFTLNQVNLHFLWYIFLYYNNY